MMNPAHIHLLLNHSPIIGTIIALIMFGAALIGKSNELKQASLALLILIALVAIPAFMSGFAAQGLIKDDPDVSMDLIQTHQGAALLAFVCMEITGAAALFALWRFSRTVKNPFESKPSGATQLVVLVLAAATVGLMAITGTTGGDIRHPEITTAGATSIVGSLGARIMPVFQFIVIDYSMWVWPILEDLHFLGLILLLGTTGALNLRILGLLKRLPVAPLHRYIPWGIAGFIVNIITGMLFFMGMPGFYVPNVVFQIKMLTILLAGGNLLLFYCTSAFTSLEEVGPGQDAPAFAKFMAAASIFLWIAVIVLGRYIPFGEVT
jgi:uncharacterized membrane protein